MGLTEWEHPSPAPLRHPRTMEGKLPALVQAVNDRHRREAEEAWARQKEGDAFQRKTQFS